MLTCVPLLTSSQSNRLAAQEFETPTCQARPFASTPVMDSERTRRSRRPLPTQGLFRSVQLPQISHILATRPGLRLMTLSLRSQITATTFLTPIATSSFMRLSPKRGRRPRSEDILKGLSLHLRHLVLITAPQTIASMVSVSMVQIPMNAYATKDGQATCATKTSTTVPRTLVRTGDHVKTASTLLPAFVFPASMETTARIILTIVPQTLVLMGEHAMTVSILIPALAFLASMEITARIILTNVHLIHASMDHAQMAWPPLHAPATRAGWAPSVMKSFQIV